MFEKVGSTESKDVLMPVFKSDVLETEELIHSVGPLGGVTDMSPVSMSGTSFDAIAAWRNQSEKYRNARLAREKTAEKPMTGNISTQALENNPGSGKPAETFNETEFQQDYENDILSISSGEGEKQYSQQVKIIKKLSTANLEIVPDLIVEPEPHEIEPQNGVLTVAEVMTENVISVIESMTIEQVASIFNNKKITGVPVVNYHNKELTGFISMSDIISHLFEKGIAYTLHEENHALLPETLSIMDKKVSDLMQSDIIQVSAGSSIKEACSLMLDNHIHRVLVTQNKQVKGILTAYDAVRILAKFEVNVPMGNKTDYKNSYEKETKLEIPKAKVHPNKIPAGKGAKLKTG